VSVQSIQLRVVVSPIVPLILRGIERAPWAFAWIGAERLAHIMAKLFVRVCR